jgi:hypothetical protein
MPGEARLMLVYWVHIYFHNDVSLPRVFSSYRGWTLTAKLGVIKEMQIFGNLIHDRFRADTGHRTPDVLVVLFIFVFFASFLGFVSFEYLTVLCAFHVIAFYFLSSLLNALSCLPKHTPLDEGLRFVSSLIVHAPHENVFLSS